MVAALNVLNGWFYRYTSKNVMAERVDCNHSDSFSNLHKYVNKFEAAVIRAKISEKCRW